MTDIIGDDGELLSGPLAEPLKLSLFFFAGYLLGKADGAPRRKGPRRKSHTSRRRRKNPAAGDKLVDKVKP